MYSLFANDSHFISRVGRLNAVAFDGLAVNGDKAALVDGFNAERLYR